MLKEVCRMNKFGVNTQQKNTNKTLPLVITNPLVLQRLMEKYRENIYNHHIIRKLFKHFKQKK